MEDLTAGPDAVQFTTTELFARAHNDARARTDRADPAARQRTTRTGRQRRPYAPRTRTDGVMTTMLLAALVGVGTYLLVTGDRPLAARVTLPRLQTHVGGFPMLGQAGLDGVGPMQFALASGAVGLAAAIPAAVLFGGPAAGFMASPQLVSRP